MANDDILRRVPPQSIEAERSVLGALLIDNKAIDEAGAILRTDDFYRESHREIFKAMTELHERKTPVDEITLRDMLKARGKWEAIGGAAYITELAAYVPTVASMPHYARIVREKAVLRMLAATASKIASDAYDGGMGESLTDFLADAEAKLMAVTRERVWNEPSLEEAIDRVIAEAERGQLAGVQTGFGVLDDKLAGGGLGRKTLNILAASTSIGKSAMALNIALQPRGGTLVLSVEMGMNELIRRAMADVGWINWMEIAQRQPPVPDEGERAMLQVAKQTLLERAVSILYRRKLTPSTVRAEARQALRQFDGKMDLIVVDYLQLMRPDKHDSKRQRNEELGEITAALKDLAGEMDCPVLLLSQLNRESQKSEEGEPELRHLRDSGAIEQDADVVIFMWPPKAKDQLKSPDHILRWKIAKQRNGPIGRLHDLRFDRQFTRFRDA